MRILVVGAGVTASVYVGKLLQAGHHVVMLARGRRLAGLRTHGLVPEDASGQRTVLPAWAVDVAGAGERRDLVLVPVRAQLAAMLPIRTGVCDGPDEVSFANSAGRADAVTEAARRPEFDVLRDLVVAGLVVFHSAVVFATGTSWFVKDIRPGIGFSVFLLWGSLWGMPLLFLVSGMGARYAVRTRSVAAFARERLARLGVPGTGR